MSGPTCGQLLQYIGPTKTELTRAGTKIFPHHFNFSFVSKNVEKLKHEKDMTIVIRNFCDPNKFFGHFINTLTKNFQTYFCKSSMKFSGEKNCVFLNLTGFLIICLCLMKLKELTMPTHLGPQRGNRQTGHWDPSLSTRN